MTDAIVTTVAVNSPGFQLADSYKVSTASLSKLTLSLAAAEEELELLDSMLVATELAAGMEDAGVDDAGSEDAGVDDAGSDDAGIEDAGVDDAGMLDAAGVLDAAGELELSATEELLLDFLLSSPPQAASEADNTMINGRFLSISKLLK